MSKSKGRYCPRTFGAAIQASPLLVVCFSKESLTDLANDSKVVFFVVVVVFPTTLNVLAVDN